MEIDNQDYNDPRFEEVLETCLYKEIDERKKVLAERKEQLKKIKTNVQIKMCKRKELKERIKEMKQTMSVLTVCSKRLKEHIKETNDALDLIKANADDHYKIMTANLQEYENILNDYKTTWEEYHNEYEDFPLAKVRREMKVDVGKLRIEEMIMNTKIAELKKMLKQKKNIQWIRMRAKIIEFAEMMINRSKMERDINSLNIKIKDYKKELQSLEAELNTQRKKEEEDEKNRNLKLLGAPPPKINLSHIRPVPRNQSSMFSTFEGYSKWKQNYECMSVDSISINSVALEELCANEEDPVDKRGGKNSVEQVDVTSPPSKGKKLRAESSINQMEIDDAGAQEKTDHFIQREGEIEAHAKNMAHQHPIRTNAEVNAQKTGTLDTSMNMETKAREILENKRQRLSQKSHNSDVDTEYEKVAKKTRTSEPETQKANPIEKQRDDAVVNESTSSVSHNAEYPRDKFSSDNLPRVKKIETVHYNISTLPKYTPSSVPANSMFSPHYCNSDITSFLDNEVAREDSSIFDGSLCNFKMSDMNFSPISKAGEDVEMERVNSGKCITPPAKDDNKNTENLGSPRFRFNNMMKRAQGNFMFF